MDFTFTEEQATISKLAREIFERRATPERQRMADGFIDVEAIRWTTWHAAWLIAKGRPAERAARIAKYWAADAGARVAATTQHAHGGIGIGIDTTYPLHRYFLWAKQNELTLGSASQQLAHLGNTYPEGRP